MHAPDRTDLLALRGDARVHQLPGAPALSHPFGGGPGGSVCVGDLNVAAKADHVAEAEFREKGEQLLIAETAIGENGDAAAGGCEFGQTPQTRILEIVALFRQLVLPTLNHSSGAARP